MTPGELLIMGYIFWTHSDLREAAADRAQFDHMAHRYQRQATFNWWFGTISICIGLANMLREMV